MKISKLCLGTAQLGMNYGINNSSGKPSIEQSKEIIRLAVDNGINAFDTAPEYGDSESILSQSLEGYENIRKEEIFFISKYSPTDWSKNLNDIRAGINMRIKESLNNLGIKQIPVYLFHRFTDIEKENSLILKELIKLKKKRVIQKIGVSVYTPEEASRAASIDGIEVIQLPFNLIDKRPLENGFLKKAKKKGIIILARSVFLQGLFFKDEIPAGLEEFKPYKEKILTLCKEEKMSVSEMALRYAISIDEIDSVLIGLERREQLIENLKIFRKGRLENSVLERVNSWGSAPENLINPSLWKLKKKDDIR